MLSKALEVNVSLRQNYVFSPVVMHNYRKSNDYD